MAVPTTTKTWESTVNNLVAGNSSQSSQEGYLDRRNLMFALKEGLTDGGTFTTPWAVESSCNASTADASDNWNSVADILWNTSDASARSWIVLYNSGLGLRMLIDLVHGTNQNGVEVDMYVSRNTYTGGSTTSRPTTTEEMVMLTNLSADSTESTWGTGAAASSHNFIWHILMASDGSAMRVMIGYNSIALGLWTFEKPENPPVGWNGLITAIYTEKLDTGRFPHVDETINGSWDTLVGYFPDRRTEDDGIVTNKTLVYYDPGSIDSGAANHAPVQVHPVHPLTGNPVVYRWNWISKEAGTNFRLGRAMDSWLVRETLMSHGDTAPLAQEDFIVWGQFVFPWDGASTPIIT